jgi:histidyl-tRNA synthetase
MMAKEPTSKLKARLPRGLMDRGPAELAAEHAMLEKIRAVFERYGFEAVETPAIEYTDVLGKFLPDQDRPHEGVFSFQDDDEQWLSLRYDLTAPLARYVAENFDRLPKPYRSYRVGYVFRNEKPGPGRYRQFLQFDADTVGAASVAADAEMCMLAEVTLDELGLSGKYRIRVCHRKILDGVLEAAGVPEGFQRVVVLRAIDKLDRLGIEGVAALLGQGRRDESGDFTQGANLAPNTIEKLMLFVDVARIGAQATMHAFDTGLVTMSMSGASGAEDIETIASLILAAGYEDRVKMDFSVVRGLEYYTGPVYEADLTFEIKGVDGNPVRFGSVAGGGRYDGLVGRFRPEQVPATGFSIGVSRLMAALQHLGKIDTKSQPGPVVVTVFDRERIADYQRMVKSLRDAGIRAELYLGSGKMGPQMRYADRRNAPCVVIQGGDEKARGEVQIKDLIEGAKAAQSIASHTEWKETRAAQVSVKEADLVTEVRKILVRHGIR